MIADRTISSETRAEAQHELRLLKLTELQRRTRQKVSDEMRRLKAVEAGGYKAKIAVRCWWGEG